MSAVKRDRTVQIYGLLLRAYPRSYRERFGGDMRETFLREHRNASGAGVLTRIAFWSVTIAQALWFGALQRWPASGRRRSHALLRAADLRHAWRLLVRSPVFTLTAVLSLALGIGAATTIFALADGLFLQASPGVREPHRIVDLERTTNGRGHGTLAYPAFEHLRDHTTTLDALAAVTTEPAALSLAAGDTSERVYGSGVSATYFDVLGVGVSAGRLFEAGEDDPRDARAVVVLSHRLWQARFGAAPGTVGREIRLNDVPFVIIGVAAPGFEGHSIAGADLWLPITALPSHRGEGGRARLTDPRYTWHKAIGRVKSGATREAAHHELSALFDRFKSATPAVPEAHGLRLTPGGRLPAAARVPFAAFIGLLFVLTAGLLVVACSNVAGVLLARATDRRREMATRLAVGASRGQLIAQMLVEVLLLFALGGLAAIPVMLWMAAAMQAMLPALPIPLSFELTVGARAGVFAAAVALGAALLFGLAPARHALRADVTSLLQGHTLTAGREPRRVRQVLVVTQVALSLATVISAGLFVRSLQAASDLDVGFETRHVLVVSLDTTLAGATGQRAVALTGDLVEGVRRIPGIEAVGHGRMLPLHGGGFHVGGIRVPGLADPQALRDDVNWDVVSPGYFRAISLPLVAGRPFEDRDRDGAPLVAIVNETFARIAWSGGSAVGQHVFQTSGDDAAGRPLEVVGVARDARNRTVAEAPRPFIYVPFAQQPQTRVEMFVRHEAGRDVSAAVREAIRMVQPALPVVTMQKFEEAAAVGLLPQRLAAWIGGAVGAIGILLAGLGVYGLAAFTVAQRTREIAIRMALGATRREISAMVLGEVWRVGLFALPAGGLLAWGIGRAIQGLNLLVDVSATDVLAYVAPAVVMLVVLAAATALPARRAAAGDPAGALRAQ